MAAPPTTELAPFWQLVLAMSALLLSSGDARSDDAEAKAAFINRSDDLLEEAAVKSLHAPSHAPALRQPTGLDYQSCTPLCAVPGGSASSLVLRSETSRTLCGVFDDFCLAEAFAASEASTHKYHVSGPFRLGTSRVGYDGKKPSSGVAEDARILRSRRDDHASRRTDGCSMFNVEIVEATPTLNVLIEMHGITDHGWGGTAGQYSVNLVDRMGKRETVLKVSALKAVTEEARSSGKPQDFTITLTVNALKGGEILRIYLTTDTSGCDINMASMDVTLTDKHVANSALEVMYIQTLSGFSIVPEGVDVAEHFAGKVGGMNEKVAQLIEMKQAGKSALAMWMATFGDVLKIGAIALLTCVGLPLYLEVGSGYLIFAFLVEAILSDEVEAINYLYSDEVPRMSEATVTGSYAGLVHFQPHKYSSGTPYLSHIEDMYGPLILASIRSEITVYRNLAKAIAIASLFGEFIYDICFSDRLASLGFDVHEHNLTAVLVSAIPLILCLLAFTLLTYRLVRVVTEEVSVQAFYIPAAPIAKSWSSGPLLPVSFAEVDPNTPVVIPDAYILERAMLRQCMISKLLLRNVAGLKTVRLPKAQQVVPFLFQIEARDEAELTNGKEDHVLHLLQSPDGRLPDQQNATGNLYWLKSAIPSHSIRASARQPVQDPRRPAILRFESIVAYLERLTVPILLDGNDPAILVRLRQPFVVRALLAETQIVLDQFNQSPISTTMTKKAISAAQTLAYCMQHTLHPRQGGIDVAARAAHHGATEMVSGILVLCEKILAPISSSAEGIKASMVATSDSISDEMIVQNGSFKTSFEATDNQAGHWLILDLGKIMTLHGVRLTWPKEWRSARPYTIEGSLKGKKWQILADRSELYRAGGPATTAHDFKDATSARFLRITSTGVLTTYSHLPAGAEVKSVRFKLLNMEPIESESASAVSAEKMFENVKELTRLLSAHLRMYYASVLLNQEEVNLNLSTEPLSLDFSPAWRKYLLGRRCAAPALLLNVDTVGLTNLGFSATFGAVAHGRSGGFVTNLSHADNDASFPEVIAMIMSSGSDAAVGSTPTEQLVAHTLVASPDQEVEALMQAAGLSREHTRLFVVLKAFKRDGDAPHHGDGKEILVQHYKITDSFCDRVDYEHPVRDGPFGFLCVCSDISSTPEQIKTEQSTARLFVVAFDTGELCRNTMEPPSEPLSGISVADAAVNLATFNNAAKPLDLRALLHKNVVAYNFNMIYRAVNSHADSANRMSPDVKENHRDKGKVLETSHLVYTVSAADNSKAFHAVRTAAEKGGGQPLRLG